MSETSKILQLGVSGWNDARTLSTALSGWIFRGLEDADAYLSTGIHQNVNLIGGFRNPNLAAIERHITYDFQRRADIYLTSPPPDDHPFEWASIIQHFGGPTRLVDCTRSWYIAAFLAMESAQKQCAVWCVNVGALHKSLERQKVIALADFPEWEIPYRLSESANAHMLETTAEKTMVPLVFDVEPFQLDERLSTQQTVFLCPASISMHFMQSLAGGFGLATDPAQPLSTHPEFRMGDVQQYRPAVHTLDTIREKYIVKMIFSPEIYREALMDLWGMNVTAATLFPGVDGFARSMRYHCGTPKSI